MASIALRVHQVPKPKPTFPETEVRRRLSSELKKISDDNALLRPEWEPVLDSKRVVAAVVMIEDLFPGLKIPPDKVVKKGGYHSIDEALNDMIPRLKRVLSDQSQTQVRK